MYLRYIAAVLALSGSPAIAQQAIVQARTGQPIRVWGVFDCAGGIPAVAGTASNGTLSTKQIRANKSRCGHDKGVMVEFYYKSNAGFKGTDTVYIMSGSRRDVKINVQ